MISSHDFLSYLELQRKFSGMLHLFFSSVKVRNDSDCSASKITIYELTYVVYAAHVLYTSNIMINWRKILILNCYL